MSSTHRRPSDARAEGALGRAGVPRPEAERGPDRATGDQPGVLSFLFWCDFAGVGPVRHRVRDQGRLYVVGGSEPRPGNDFWELLRRNPGYPWILAPGANVQHWDPQRFGRPNVYRMESG